MFWEILDWSAFGVTLYGVWLLSKYKRSGFIINVAGSLLWVIVGLHSKLYGLLVLNAVLLLIYLKGYLNWGVKKNIQE